MKYSITITGDLGSGKSTVARLLAEKLGYIYYSTGLVQRELAKEKGLTTLELNLLSNTDKSIDEKIDGVFVKMNQDKTHYVVDSRMAWHFMTDSFKVKLIVDSCVAVERIMRDSLRTGEKKYKTAQEALSATQQRRKSERERFLSTYGVDIEDNSLFDLVVDTTNKTQEEVCKFILEAYQK